MKNQEEAKVAQHPDDEAYAGLLMKELAIKKWSELEVVEHGDYLLFPERIYKRRKNGEFEEFKVMLRVPRKHELRKARVMAYAMAQQEGISPERDVDIFVDMENLCILWMAIRSPSEPFEPFEVDPEALDKKFDKDALNQVWAKLEGYRSVIDPSPSNVTEEQALALIAAIAEGRNILPLRAFDGNGQNSCIVFMASLLHNLLKHKSLSQLLETSTRGP